MLNWTSVLVWMATYWLHSTLLLGGTWFWLRWQRPQSYALRDTIWKFAAVGALVTASLQLGLGIESPANFAARIAWQKSELALGRQASNSNQNVVPIPVAPLHQDQGQASLLATGSGSERGALVSTSELPPNAIYFVSEELPENKATIADSVVGFRNVGLPNDVALSENKLPPTASDSSGYAFIFRVVTAVVMALGGAIIALSILGFVRLLWNHFQFGQRMKKCRVVQTGSAFDTLQELRRQSEIRRPVLLLIADDAIEPGAWGLGTWRIVLPPRALEELSCAELRALLAHELAHLVRGDQNWLWIGHLLSVCFAWQPLNRMAFREWRLASEFLSDAWAIGHHVNRLSLARCLTSVAEWRMVSAVPLVGVRGDNRSTLTHRVERLLNDAPLSDPWLTRSRRQVLIAGSSLLIVTMICCAPTASLFAKPELHSAVVIENTDSHEHDSDARIDFKQIESNSEELASEELAAASRLDNQDVPPGFRPIQKQTGAQQGPFDESLFDSFQLRLQSTTVKVDSFPQDQINRVVLLEISNELSQLSQDLTSLDQLIATNPQLVRSPRVLARLQRFRVSLQGFIRIRETISTTIEL